MSIPKPLSTHPTPPGMQAEIENIYRFLNIMKTEASADAVSEITIDLSGYVPKNAFTAKGDMLVATGSGSPSAFPVGTDGQVIVADAASAKGMKYIDVPAKGNDTEIQFNDSGDLAGDSNFVWDNTNKRLGVGVDPAEDIHADGTVRSDTGFDVAGAPGSTVVSVPVYNDGATSGQLTSLTFTGGILTGYSIIP